MLRQRLLFSLSAILFSAYSVVAQVAHIQLLHNSADPSVADVDIYVNGTLVFDNLHFRTASAVVDVNADEELVFAIAPSSSSSAAEAFFFDTTTFTSNSENALILSGVINTDLFSNNPDPNAAPLNLTLKKIEGVHTGSSASGRVDVIALHGSTDSPGVDIYADTQLVIAHAVYGSQSGYKTLDAQPTVFGIAPVGQKPISAFKAELENYADQAIYLVASGFLNPNANQNGPVFGMFIVTRNGGPFNVLQPTTPPLSASVQFINNSADPLFDSIDVYLGPIKILDDFKFRYATSFLDLPSDKTLSVSVAPGNSQSVADAVSTLQKTFGVGRYIVVLSGVADTTSFVKNPDLRAPSIAFQAFQIDNVKPNATSPSDVDIIFFHGVTDMEAVDVYTNGSTKIASDVVYSKNTDYINLPADKYLLGLAAVESGVFKQYYANLQPLAGKSLFVLTSGFSDPGANNNGEAYGMYAATTDGGQLIEFPIGTTSVEENLQSKPLHVMPNPAADYVTIEFDLEKSANVGVTITDITGTTLHSADFGNNRAGLFRHTIPTEALTSGTYRVVLHVGSMNFAYPLIIVH